MPKSNTSPLFTDAERAAIVAKGLAAIAAAKKTATESLEVFDNARDAARTTQVALENCQVNLDSGREKPKKPESR